jgi:hypothetical protein
LRYSTALFSGLPFAPGLLGHGRLGMHLSLGLLGIHRAARLGAFGLLRSGRLTLHLVARNGDRAARNLEVRFLMARQEKITFGEMRASGASRIIVHCGNYKCGRSVTMYPALWPDNVRLSELEDRFVCTVCGHRGADGSLLSRRAGAPNGRGKTSHF